MSGEPALRRGWLVSIGRAVPCGTGDAWQPQPVGSRAVLEPEGYQLLFGDPHIHSRMSGEPDEACRFARDVDRLDLAILTENDYTRLAESPYYYCTSSSTARSPLWNGTLP